VGRLRSARSPGGRQEQTRRRQRSSPTSTTVAATSCSSWISFSPRRILDAGLTIAAKQYFARRVYRGRPVQNHRDPRRVRSLSVHQKALTIRGCDILQPKLADHCIYGGVLFAMPMNSSSVSGNSLRIAVHTPPGVAAAVVASEPNRIRVG